MGDDPSDDDCSQYIVLVADPAVEELDAYGPLSYTAAQIYVAKIRVDLLAGGVEGVMVRVVPVRGPPPTSAGD